jgi:hypothetical protein
MSTIEAIIGWTSPTKGTGCQEMCTGYAGSGKGDAVHVKNRQILFFRKFMGTDLMNIQTMESNASF